MTALVDPYRWQALGDGYFAPAGSVVHPLRAPSATSPQEIPP